MAYGRLYGQGCQESSWKTILVISVEITSDSRVCLPLTFSLQTIPQGWGVIHYFLEVERSLPVLWILEFCSNNLSFCLWQLNSQPAPGTLRHASQRRRTK